MGSYFTNIIILKYSDSDNKTLMNNINNYMLKHNFHITEDGEYERRIVAIKSNNNLFLYDDFSETFDEKLLLEYISALKSSISKMILCNGVWDSDLYHIIIANCGRMISINRGGSKNKLMNGKLLEKIVGKDNADKMIKTINREDVLARYNQKLWMR